MSGVRRVGLILVLIVVFCSEGAAHGRSLSCQRYGCLQANEGAEAELRAGGSVSPQEDRPESHRVLCAGQLSFPFSNKDGDGLVLTSCAVPSRTKAASRPSAETPEWRTSGA